MRARGARRRVDALAVGYEIGNPAWVGGAAYPPVTLEAQGFGALKVAVLPIDLEPCASKKRLVCSCSREIERKKRYELGPALLDNWKDSIWRILSIIRGAECWRVA